jgi:hypothetical protein
MGLATRCRRYRSVRLVRDFGAGVECVDYPMQVGRRGFNVEVLVLSGASFFLPSVGERGSRYRSEQCLHIAGPLVTSTIDKECGRAIHAAAHAT